ncbi:aminotransferase DegT [Clostridium sp. DMHC 10]|uniref:DegT/DnrJ/EryC1/StrS family aminotransferase n=1 Tax=Clostridium sp. DMHC 10 TaxID=747377 RepID=UPI00069D0BE4|nr:DegT/DnrJ/EryC1/StrS family aminotransferase [Clostridium sp. DMHC 10]KOF55976.1 aminotransferase DegT [Clostridium sp. DMHC 10]
MINVTKTYIPSLDKYNVYLKRIFSGGVVTNNGQFLKKLQKELGDYLGVKNILLVQNGTLALQIAYKLLKLTGDVITTPFTFVATVSSQVWEGLNPKFVDINSETLNIDEKSIEKNITPKVSGIVPVHVFGNGCEVEYIDKIAKNYGIKVIYDAAHAFGVKYKNKSILNYGDISIMSFHATKIFHTIEGGALVIKDDELYKKACLMINFGIDGVNSISELGINAKMNELEAAMGLCILDDIDKIIDNRRKVYEYYMNHLKGNIIFQKHNEKSSLNYSYFPIILNSEECVIRVMKMLSRENINPRRYFYPSLSTLSYVRDNANVPVANDVSRRILCLPFYDSIEIKELKTIVDIVNKNI